MMMTSEILDYDYIEGRNRYLPDIISFLQNSTNLKRNTIVDILKRSDTLYMFYINPHKYMSDVSAIINRGLVDLILTDVKYTKIEGRNSAYKKYSQMKNYKAV